MLENILLCNKRQERWKRPIVLNVEETAEINTSAIKTIQGHLELKYKNGSWDDSPDFAFIGDYYVHHSVLCEYNITKDCYVTADVIYAGQGKWKVIKYINRIIWQETKYILFLLLAK